MDDNKKAVLVVVVVVVVVVAVAVALFVGDGSVDVEQMQQPAAGTAQLPAGGSTRSAAPVDIAVPAQNATSVPQNVAVPVAVDPASGSANFRSYNIKIDKNKFTPDTVIVNQWDTVRINFTSVDRDYDVKQPDFGFAVAIPKGTSGVWESSASGGGTFKFYCVACGGPESGPAGYLIVKASGE